MRVRSNWPMFSALIRSSLKRHLHRHPGRHIDELPPDHTAEFKAENLLSPGGMMVPKCSLNQLWILL